MLISRITADLAFTREEVYKELMKVEDEGLSKIIKTLEPGARGLLNSKHLLSTTVDQPTNSY